MSFTISRIDSTTTHAFLARVYRVGWSRGKSFSDRLYGGQEKAESAARRWAQRADAMLPVIPPKPVQRKATVYEREEKRRTELWYFDVYTPPEKGDTTWSTKFYFSSEEEKREAEKEARQLARQRNLQLHNEYQNALAAWKMEYKTVLADIERKWEEVKILENQPSSPLRQNRPGANKSRTEDEKNATAAG